VQALKCAAAVASVVRRAWNATAGRDWLVLDGPVDELRSAPLLTGSRARPRRPLPSSVVAAALEGTGQLFLPSGEVLMCAPFLSVVFEVPRRAAVRAAGCRERRARVQTSDVSRASPALLSRCGLVSLSPSPLNWQNVVRVAGHALIGSAHGGVRAGRWLPGWTTRRRLRRCS
jgi:hypothetical protein